jgi:hypothetical protein
VFPGVGAVGREAWFVQSGGEQKKMKETKKKRSEGKKRRKEAKERSEGKKRRKRREGNLRQERE